MKKITKTLLLLLAIICVSSCGKKDLSEGTIEGVTYKETSVITNVIKIEMANDDIILVELYPEIAPITVENFQKLVGNEFYDKSRYHRVINGFMIQGGKSSKGEEARTIIGEFSINGIENSLKHERGVISMARLGDDPETSYTMNSASSEFFIMHQDEPFLDGKYAAFGKVIAGMSAVDSIAKVKTDVYDEPIQIQTIRSIRFVEIS